MRKRDVQTFPENNERIIREPERAFLTGMSRTQWWRNERAGLTPKRIMLGEIAHGWVLGEIKAWVNERKAARKPGAKKSA